jgi:16S rRNA (cytidine1402-2'-O)-methyltransferase
MGKRAKFFEALKLIQATLLFLENPKRTLKTLNEMALVFGPRDVAIGRELTKKFEEIRKGTLRELCDHYSKVGPPKGEVTIVVAPPSANEIDTPEEAIDRLLKKSLTIFSLKDAVSIVVEATGASKRDVYTRALKMDLQIK